MPALAPSGPNIPAVLTPAAAVVGPNDSSSDRLSCAPVVGQNPEADTVEFPSTAPVAYPAALQSARAHSLFASSHGMSRVDTTPQNGRCSEPSELTRIVSGTSSVQPGSEYLKVTGTSLCAPKRFVNRLSTQSCDSSSHTSEAQSNLGCGI